MRQLGYIVEDGDGRTRRTAAATGYSEIRHVILLVLKILTMKRLHTIHQPFKTNHEKERLTVTNLKFINTETIPSTCL